MAFLQLVRYPNLGIVLFTQFLFYWFIQQVFRANDLTPILDLPHFSLLVLTTICIAASGYIINDLMDHEIDRINKPEKMIIGQKISIPKATSYYFITIALGTLVALYLAWYVQNLYLFVIYPLAVFIMWLYSKSLKKQPLSGNLVVALFAAFVPGIVWFAERAGFSNLVSEQGIQMRNLFQFYMFFAFSSTLYREVIKDIEDYQGDVENNCRTLPIVLGISKAKRITILLGAVLLFSTGYWIFSQWESLRLIGNLLSWALLIIPILFSIQKVYVAKTKADFHQSSQIAKWVMLGGLVYLLLFLVIQL